MAKRTVDRQLNLPTIRCDLAELESLVNKVIEHFGPGSRLGSSISIDLETEKFSFDDFTDVRSYAELPAKLTNISIYISDINSARRCTFSTSGIFQKTAQVHVSADNEAWCAGATEIFRDFGQRHKQWYHFINKIPVFGIFIIISIFPGLLRFMGVISMDNFSYIISWILASFVLLLISLIRKKSFPSAIVIIRHEKAKWREYVPELSLAIAVLALIITLIGLIIQSNK